MRGVDGTTRGVTGAAFVATLGDGGGDGGASVEMGGDGGVGGGSGGAGRSALAGSIKIASTSEAASPRRAQSRSFERNARRVRRRPGAVTRNVAACPLARRAKRSDARREAPGSTTSRPRRAE